MPTICPIDGTADTIQKVSGVVALGEQEGSFSGPTGGVAYVGGKAATVAGYSSMSGSVKTKLARQLRHPPAPTRRSAFSPLMWLAYVWSAGALLCALPFGFFGLFSGMQDAGPPLLLGIVGAVAFFWFRTERPRRAKLAEEDYALAKAAWARAHDWWDALYYCYRDDIVFDPGTAEVFKPEELQSRVANILATSQDA